MPQNPFARAFSFRQPVADVGVDLCVIGAGSGGLSVAAGAAQMGASVVLVERHHMGGDCLNTGCVPSKALIAAAHAAQVARSSGRFGVNGHEPAIDFSRVHAHVHGVIGAIAPHDSEERFEGLGVTVIKGEARFTGPDEIAAGDTRIRARRFVIAAGSSPSVPEIPGLSSCPYLTNESIFDLTERPDHLVVLGGGRSVWRWPRRFAASVPSSHWCSAARSCRRTNLKRPRWCAAHWRGKELPCASMPPSPPSR